MSQQTSTEVSIENQIIPVLLNNGKEGLKHLLYYQFLTKCVPTLLRGTIDVIKSIAHRRMKRHIESITQVSIRNKTSSVMLQREYDKENDLNILFDAVLSYVSELPQTKHVKRTSTGVFIMASNDEIEISPCIFVRKVGESLTNDKITKLCIEVYSYTYDLCTLRKYLEDIEEKYEMALSNQLGKNIYYFDEIPLNVPLGLNRKPDLTKAPPRLVFTKYPLHTNKSLKNIYGDSVKKVRKRIDFFMNNKRWYEEKGVPYTLGLLLHGVPGAGKTSCIKSIAKDTNRHVLNIRLNENTTVSQLNALFYSSQVQVLQNGENKFYDIPIDKRIIVLEDVDCLTDVVLSRDVIEENKVIKEVEKVDEKKTTNSDELDGFGRRIVPYDNTTNLTPGENQKLNLSILLNILDGVLEQPGRILIMTSNHPEKLDKALIRPGRIDVIVRFDYCKRHEVIEIVEAFTGQKVDGKKASKIADGVYTPAEVTRIIFENIECLDDIIENLIEKRCSITEPKVISNVDISYQEMMTDCEGNTDENTVDDEDKHNTTTQLDISVVNSVEVNNGMSENNTNKDGYPYYSPTKDNNLHSLNLSNLYHGDLFNLNMGTSLDCAFESLQSENDCNLDKMFEQAGVLC